MAQESRITELTPAEEAAEAAAEAAGSSSGPATAENQTIPGVDMSQPVGKLDKKMVDQIVKANPALRAETEGMDPAAVQKMLETMKLRDLLAGMVSF